MYSSSSRIIDWLSQSGSEIDDATPVNPRKRPISPASSDAMEQKPGAKRARVQPQFDAYSPAGTLVSPEDDEEATPRRRNPAPSDAQSSSAASSQQTSDNFDSAATPSERRKKSRGIAFASSMRRRSSFLTARSRSRRLCVCSCGTSRSFGGRSTFVWPALLVSRYSIHTVHLLCRRLGLTP